METLWVGSSMFVIGLLMLGVLVFGMCVLGALVWAASESIEMAVGQSVDGRMLIGFDATDFEERTGRTMAYMDMHGLSQEVRCVAERCNTVMPRMFVAVPKRSEQSIILFYYGRNVGSLSFAQIDSMGVVPAIDYFMELCDKQTPADL